MLRSCYVIQLCMNAGTLCVRSTYIMAKIIENFSQMVIFLVFAIKCCDLENYTVVKFFNLIFDRYIKKVYRIEVRCFFFSFGVFIAMDTFEGVALILWTKGLDKGVENFPRRMGRLSCLFSGLM